MIFNIVIILFNILFLTIGVNRWSAKEYGLNKNDIKVLKNLFIYHQVISVCFSFYITKFGGDALLYWFVNNKHDLDYSWTSYYGTGTMFLKFICYPLVKFFNISFFAGGLLFGFVGYLGFVYAYLIVRKFTKKTIVLYSLSIFPLLLFLPNLNFWSSGIGKDSLMFFAIMLFLYALFNYKRKFLWGIFALALIYHIRPPMALFLLLSVLIAGLLDSKLKVSYKVLLSIIMLGTSGLLYSSVLASVQIDKLNGESIEQFSESRTTNLSKDAGSGINTTDYPLPLKVFTFLYRPLFFDINGPLAIVASFENLLLLWLSLMMVFKLNIYIVFKNAPFQIKTLILYFIIASVSFSLILGNLGIMLRMKIMIVPSLLIFIFWCIAYLNHQKQKKIREAYKLHLEKIDSE
jgi:hypothetical protein